MRLTYSTYNISNTGLVSDDGRELYHISTSRWGQKTTVRKLTDGSPPTHVPLAVIRFRWRKDLIEWGDRTIEARSWLEKSGTFSSARTFTTAGGQQYKWRTDSVRWWLERADGSEVARSHNASLGIIGKTKHKAYLDIGDDISADIDDVVVSFVYLKVLQERQQSAANSASSSAAAGAAAAAAAA
ncbi:hypothetical protein K488DRAFT_83880 [Vararia minispora EC-137]|uniref:Uncharacterized protein n=1 Tax=Vararia minispora EC-137 TaxID=1314806 RepID=A0ACB8QS86_9AGAM|nr:hypothetical protein K488DRAFT_83880 [Vararia minispora EC-137]